MEQRSAAFLGAFMVGAVWCAPGLAMHFPPLARAIDVPLRMRSGGGVALTFDDGPHPEGTPMILAELARRGATATFFVVAEQVERRPGLAGEIAAAGHELAVHGYRHRNQMRLLPRAFAEDLARAVEVIGEAAQRPPRLYRPPYGIFTPVGRAQVSRASLDALLWSRWGRDWRANTNPAEIARLASDGIVIDDVVLLHDADWYSAPGSHRDTARALPRILDAIEERGLRTVRVP